MCLDFKPKKSSNYDGINDRNHRLEIECTALGMHSQNTDAIVKLGMLSYVDRQTDHVIFTSHSKHRHISWVITIQFDGWLTGGFLKTDQHTVSYSIIYCLTLFVTKFQFIASETSIKWTPNIKRTPSLRASSYEPVNRAGLVSEISPRHSFLCKNIDEFMGEAGLARWSR